MNLQGKGARRSLAAVCSTAVVAAGVSFMAAPAQAAGVTLGFGPTATSATIVNLDPTVSATTAGTAYGLKITGSSVDSAPVRVAVLSGPTNGVLKIQRRAGNGIPVPTSAVVTAATTVGTAVVAGDTSVAVASSTGFAAGDAVALTGADGLTEYALVSSTSAGHVVLDDGAVNAHAIGKAVYDLGPAGASTTLTADPGADATSLTVGSTAGMSVGDLVSIAGDTLAHGQVRRITAKTGTTLTVAAISHTDADHDVTMEVVDLGPGTDVHGAVTAADTSVTVASTAGFAAGDNIVISDATTTETLTVSAITSGTVLALAEAATAAHATGSAVFKVGATASGWTSVPVGVSRQVPGFNLATNNDSIYLAARTPGAYTLQFFKDRNGNSVYDAGQDDATPVFTLTSMDVDNVVAGTSDDLAPTLTVASSVGVGQAITPTVTTGLTSVDTRGSVSGVGVLGTAVAANSTLVFTPGATGINGGGAGALSFDGTSIYRTSDVSSTAGSASTAFSIGSYVTRSAPTTFTASSAAHVTAGSTDVAGTVKNTGGAVAVKTGTADVTYTALVTDGAGTPAPIAGETVYFTLSIASGGPVLTADGTLVSSTSTTKVYSAVTNSSGIASLKVTSATTTAGTTYGVLPKAGTITAGTTQTALYANVTPTSIDNLNTASSLIVTPGTSVDLKGRLLDQFGGLYKPSGSDPVQVAVRVAAGGATIGNAPFAADGTFSYTYAPSTTPTAGTSTSWDFYYATNTINGPDSAVNWASATAVANITISAPASTATPTQEKGTLTPAAGTAVTGVVSDASNAVLAYKPVVLTGTEGVYFSTAATPTTAATDDLATTITVAANGSGSYSAYAFFTKAGPATITVTSGTATKTVTVAVTQASDPYKVLAMDSTVGPGESSVVSGTVQNAWGFPVSGAVVNLSLGSSTVAALGSASVTTGADGIWSTTITGASAGDGDAVLTATLNTQTANATAHADWLGNAGLTIAAGVFQDTAKITVDPNINKTVLMAPASRMGSGKVTVYGKAKPGASVEIFAKTAYTSLPYALVGVATANSAGDWSDDEYVTSSTTFYAKTSVSSSSTVTVVVKGAAVAASAKVSTKALGGGVVRVSVNGMPNKAGTITVYVNGTRVRTIASNAAGDGTISVKTSRGRKTFKVVFSAPGCTAGSTSVVVTVK